MNENMRDDLMPLRSAHPEAPRAHSAFQGVTLPSAPTDSALPRLLTRLFFHTAVVTGHQEIAPGLYLISVQGSGLRERAWSPGDKVQIKVGPGMTNRTYTPIDWNPKTGETRFVAHALAHGPGSEWVRHAQVGQAIALMGPRRSLDLSAWPAATGVLVGDETSISLAAAWRPARVVLEVDQPEPIHTLLQTWNLQGELVARQNDDAHLPSLAALATLPLGGAEDSSRFVLTGRARTIQSLLPALRAQGVPRQRLLSKAYWAPGKAGLD